MLLLGRHAALVPAAEHFSVVERDGVWWFIDPAGRQFWSQGVDQIVTGPSTGDLSAQYAARRYYQDDDAWAADVSKRLHSWNFNTLGGWHDRRLRRGAWAYAEVLHLGAMEGAPWNDLFGDSFAERMDALAAKQVAPHRHDSHVLGWFTDNELAWYPEPLLDFHLKQPATSATRSRLMDLLTKHYAGNFARLKADFEPDEGVDGFAELAAGGSLRQRAGGKGQQVVEKFAEACADRYYSVVCAAVRRHDPNHLVLGDRYHGYCPDAVVRAAGRHLDVVSTNFDWPRGVDGYLPRAYLRRLHELSGKPVLITEYYATAVQNRSGNPNSGGLFVVVPTQQDRAAVVDERLRLFTEEPFVVGAHWFAYADEPPAGRAGDGEDYNFGLVDIHNQPYEEVTAAIAAGHASAAKRHAAVPTGDARADEKPLVVPRLAAPATIDAVDRRLASHLSLPSRPVGGLADLLVATDGETLYLSLAGNHYLDEHRYVEQLAPVTEGLRWRLDVATGGRQATFDARMVGDRHKLAEGDFQFTHWQRGVRFGATVALKPEDLGLRRWPADSAVALASCLADERTGARTDWSAQLTLANANRAVSEGPTLRKPPSAAPTTPEFQLAK